MLALYIVLRKEDLHMFTAEEIKAMETATTAEATCTNEICNAMSSGCTWG